MKIAVFCGLAFGALSTVLLQAALPHPDLEARLKREGKWDQFVHQYKSWKVSEDFANPDPYRARFSFSGQIPAAVPPDTIKVVVIYAAPSDRPTSADGINVTTAELQTILFGANPTGSFSDYYKEVSYGQTAIVGTVFGPYTLPQTNQYYTNDSYGRGASPNNAQQFVRDALAAADAAGVDFSQFDYNNNGAVDGLLVVHSGPGGEWTGNPSDIWSHATSIGATSYDGKILNPFGIVPEQQPGSPGPIPSQIGIVCHETGHSLFGLPDLYDIDYSSSGIGEWCLMAGGNYTNNSKTPVHLSAWCKKKVGWVNPIRLTANQNGTSIPAVEYNPVIYRLWKHGATGLEYFLVENRERTGFDSFLPGPSGLLIWHIDEAVFNNNGEPRYMVGLEQADGLRDLENNIGRGDDGDPFPGSTGNRTFDETSNPNSNSNNFQPTQVAVRNISDPDSVMTADLQVTYPQPLIVLNRTNFIFSAIYKGPPPAAKTVTITNDGGESLDWTAAWNSGWLSVSPGSATAPTTANVTVSTNVLPGAYTDTISITCPTALNTPQKMPVSYQVTSVRGDLDRNGLRSPADLAVLLNCVFVNSAGANCELLVADMNCNGQLTPADAALLLLTVYTGQPPPC